MLHFLFICWQHVPTPWVLWIMLMNKMLLQDSDFSFGHMSEVGLLVILLQVFLRNLHFPPTVDQGSLSPSSNVQSLLTFDSSHSDRCKVISLWLKFAFPWLVMLSIFHKPVGHFYVWKMCIQILAHLLIELFGVFAIEICGNSLLYILGIAPLSGNVVCKYFFSHS